MKKLTSILLSCLMLMGICAFGASAISYEQPFASGTMGSTTFRIPAILTLNNGSVIAGADLRYEHGSDSPQNIDTLIAISPDGYTNWDYTVVNNFEDYAAGTTDTNSASFIDSSIAQSKKTDRIFLITDAFPYGGGYPTVTKAGTGFMTIDGKKYLGLTTGDNHADWASFDCYVGDFDESGIACVYKVDGTVTSYTVDREYRLYKDGAPYMVIQRGTDENKQVQATVFYKESPLKVFRTCYLWFRYSDDNGATWSAPEILSKQIKAENESFLGIGPGRGTAIELPDGGERIIFTVYDTVGIFENTSTIYTDDNGATWHRGAEIYNKAGLGKTSESQIITLPNGKLRLYSRTNSTFVGYAESSDYGHSWSEVKADFALTAQGNCMVSFINTSKVIDGKNVILGSYVSNTKERADGVIRVGLVDSKGNTEWISTYHVTQGFFAYSCLTELSDGNFGYLYEDKPYAISYKVLTLSEDGQISEINGDNIEFKEKELSFFDKFVNFFKNIILELQKLFGVM